MIFLLIAFLFIGGLILTDCLMHHDVKRPLVEPAPDAFPLQYRSPYVPAGPDATLNQRLVRMGYEPVPGGSRPFYPEPPQSHSVICQCDECMKTGMLWDEQSGLWLLRRDSPPATIGETQSDAPEPIAIECEMNYE